MLAGMTVMQLQEWQAFFKIRNEKDPQPSATSGAAIPAGGKNDGLNARLMAAFQGYQKRQDEKKGMGRKTIRTPARRAPGRS